MATVTSLGFSIFSRYDGSGITRAKRDLNDLNRTLERSGPPARVFGVSLAAVTAAAVSLSPVAVAAAGAVLGIGAATTVAVIGLGAFGLAMANTEVWRNHTDRLSQSFKAFLNDGIEPLIAAPVKVWVDTLISRMTLLRGPITATSKALVQLGFYFKAVTAPGTAFARSWDTITAAMQPIIAGLGRAVINFLMGFLNLTAALIRTGLVQSMVDGIENMSLTFARWSATLDQNRGFQNFVSWVKKFGPEIWDILGRVIQALARIVMALAPFGMALLRAAGAAADFINSMPMWALTAIASGLAAIMIFGSPLRSFFIMLTGLSAKLAGMGGLGGVAASIGRILSVGVRLFGWIGLLVGLLVLAWQHSGFFRTALMALWQALVRLWNEALRPLVDEFVKLWNALEPLRVLLGIIAGFLLGVFIFALTAVVQMVAFLIQGFAKFVAALVWFITVLGPAWSAVWAGIKFIAEAVWLGLQIAWQAFLNVLIIIWQAVSGALVAAWNGIWMAIQVVAQGVWTALQIGWQVLTAIFITIWNVAGAVLSGTWSVIWNTMRFFAELVWNALTTAWQAFLFGIQAVWNVVGGAISAAWNAIWTAIRVVAQAIWTAIQVIWQNFMNTLQAIWNGFSAAFSAAWNAFWTAIRAVGQAIWVAIQAIWQSFYNTLRAIWDGFSSAFRAAWDAFWNGIKALGQAIWVAIQGIWQSFYNTLRAIWDGFSSALRAAWDAFWNGIKDLGQQIWAAIQGIWQSFYNTLRDIWDGFSSAFQTAWENTWNTVKDIAEDIWNSIGEVIEGAVNGIITVINALIKGFNNITDALGMDLNIGEIPKVNFAYGGVVGMPGFMDGGVLGFSRGGTVPGYAPGRDRVPAMLSPGEGVLTPEAVKGLGGAGFVHGANREFAGHRGAGHAANRFRRRRKGGNWHGGNMDGHPKHFALGGMAGMLPGLAAMGGITLAALARAGLGGVTIIQPEFNPGVAASAGTHDGGGVVDLPPDPGILAKLLATGEWAAWMRTPAQGFAPHIHAVLMNHPQLSGAARAQVTDFLAGGDGLGAGGGGGGIGDLFGFIFENIGKIIRAIAEKGKNLLDAVLPFASGAFKSLMGSLLGDDDGGGILGSGIGPDVGPDILPDIGGAVSDAISGPIGDMLKGAVMSAINLPAMDEGLGFITDKLKGADLPGGFVADMVLNMGEKLLKGAKDWIVKKAAELAPGLMSFLGIGGGGNVQQWAELAKVALALGGLSQNQLPAFLALMQAESGGNPMAINNSDSNAAAGDPSRGLMQVIGATFAAYHVPGTSTNIFDPLANMAAAAAYIKARYGGNVPGSPYALGTMGATRGWHLTGERGPEWVNFRGGERVLPNGEYPTDRGGHSHGDTHFHIDARGATREAVDKLDRDVVPKMRRLVQQGCGKHY